MANNLPARTADTMSDAIALSSPNGRMSKRAKEAAQKRLGDALFGDYALTSLPPQPSEIVKLEREAKQCRDLAARGMRPRAFIKQAEWCERRIALLSGKSAA
jgi:hypothetical protein